MDEVSPTNYKVPNLERGLAIMELLADNPKGLTIQEIKNNLSLAQTTVFRITQSLLHLGYLGRDDESKQFYLTRKMLTVGFRTVKEHDLLEIALPWMRQLRDQLHPERPVLLRCVWLQPAGPDLLMRQRSRRRRPRRTAAVSGRNVGDLLRRDAVFQPRHR